MTLTQVGATFSCPQPYCPELLPSNKRCNGTALLIGDRVEVELYHEQAVGQPPFIEVPCKPWYRLFSGELLGYYHETGKLVGFASPTLEFLDREVAIPLLENLSLMTTLDAAEVGCSPRYLEKLRNLGQGPKFWRVAEGQFIFEVWYDRKDVEAYAAERRGGYRKRKGDQKA